MYHKEIRYDRTTKDFAMYLDGELIGYARTYLDGEITLNQIVYDLLSNAAPVEPDATPEAERAEERDAVIAVCADAIQERGASDLLGPLAVIDGQLVDDVQAELNRRLFERVIRPAA